MRAFSGPIMNMMAYLAMMAVRADRIARVLKPTRLAADLHCDPTAGATTVKLLLDGGFWPYFVSERRSLEEKQAHIGGAITNMAYSRQLSCSNHKVGQYVRNEQLTPL